MGTQDKGDELIQAQALRANGILYDSIRDTREEPKDGDPFPPLPPRRTISRSARPKTLKTAYRRPAPALTIPTPPLLSSHLFDDSEIQRLTTFQSAPSEPSEPSEEGKQEPQSLPTRTISTQFPVPLRIPAAAARKDSFIDTTTPNAKPSEVSWTLIPHDPDWVLLDDDS